jgi:D-glycero-D-manno-heptose 1,7-bisphosphate phosphatase
MLALLDRDGVINRDMKTGILRLDDFEILPGVPHAIAQLSRAGFTVAICTNQSAIGRGQLTVSTLDAMHEMLRQQVMAAGGNIDAIYYAPDLPEQATERRKPGAGMLLEALAAFGAEPSRTPFVGDHLRDMQAAATAGCPRILVRTGHGASVEKAGLPAAIAPVTVVDDLPQAVTHILQHYAGA